MAMLFRGSAPRRGPGTIIVDPTLLVPLLLFALGHRAVSGVSVHGRYTSSPLEPRIELRDARYGARDARCSARGQAATLAHAAAAAAAPTDSA